MKNNFLQAPVRSYPGASAFVGGLLLLVVASTTSAQSSVRDYRRAHERQILAEFTRLLAIPNIAADQANIRRNAQFILEMMQRRGLSPRLLEAKSKATSPAVYGEWKAPGATRSVIFYAHYDGQPVDPKQWTASPPFEPTWRSAAMESGGQVVTLPPEGAVNPEWRLYGRAAADDKAG
ncbi:MAG TPA: hypothetical protein VIU65_01180, partial [Pyrinomonadaceae bacterium]